MELDWMDKLQELKDTLPPGDETTEIIAQETSTENTNTARLDIILEKKGRAGKTATIITGWNGTDSSLQQLAATLKKKLATGGSARGGEILIQGDRRSDVLQILLQLGYKARII